MKIITVNKIWANFNNPYRLIYHLLIRHRTANSLRPLDFPIDFDNFHDRRRAVAFPLK